MVDKDDPGSMAHWFEPHLNQSCSSWRPKQVKGFGFSSNGMSWILLIRSIAEIQTRTRRTRISKESDIQTLPLPVLARLKQLEWNWVFKMMLLTHPIRNNMITKCFTKNYASKSRNVKTHALILQHLILRTRLLFNHFYDTVGLKQCFVYVRIKCRKKCFSQIRFYWDPFSFAAKPFCWVSKNQVF